MENQTNSPLQFLTPSWFAIVMGLAGLGLAWNSAVPLMGEYARLAAQGMGVFAIICFLALAGFSLLRQQHHPEALQEDLRHPVRHAFVAAIPISMILLVTLGTVLFGPTTTGQVLWMLACIGQLAVTVWVLARWWRGNGAGGLQWAGITPIMIIPVVGNVLTPLAGMALGQPAWATAQFGLGAFLWPLVVVLLFVRIGIQGLWPERLLPSGFITVAPPAVIGLSLLQLGAAEPWAQACWGVALFFLLWSLQILRSMFAQPFSIAYWALSFPLAAFAALTLRLAHNSSFFANLAMLALALASLVIAALCVGTWRGLRNGSLLAPEVVANLQPVNTS